jgi:amino acid transporter
MTNLSRSLRLRELVIIGIVLVQPTAPMPVFGVVYQEGRGHVVTAVLIAMIAMLFTAISYGRLASVWPQAGSAYTYVSRELHPTLGFAAGWCMLLDYLLNPIICTIWCAKAAGNIAPQIPYALWALFFAGLFTFLNLRRIQTSARISELLAAGMGVVIVWMLAAAARYVAGQGTVDFAQPFYDPNTFAWPTLLTGTSVAVLTYIGFDAVSTLSEEVEDPRRNVLRATVLVCLITGVLAAIQVYAGQLVWPVGKPFPDIDTAYVHVAGLAGGPILFQTVNLTLLIASIGSGSGAQLAGARLLYGIGRDGLLPSGFFGYVDPKNNIPARNVILLGSLCAIGAFLMSYQLGAELLNFGAFIGFMGVNLAAVRRFGIRRDGDNRPTVLGFVLPALGFLVCFGIWLGLRTPAQITGAVWLAVGLVFGAWRTAGFRREIKFEERT